MLGFYTERSAEWRFEVLQDLRLQQQRRLRWGHAIRYGLAVLAVAVATGLRWAMPGVLADTPYFYLAFYPAIVFAAAFGGLGPGLLATVASAFIIIMMWVVEPQGPLSVTSPGGAMRMAVLFAGGLGISVALGLKRKLKMREKQQIEALAELVELTDLGQMLIRDDKDRIIRWSQGAQRLYGFTEQQALGRISHELLRTEFPQSLETIQKLLQTRGHWEGELTHRRADGSRVTVASLWVLRAGGKHRLTAILESDSDITEIKQTQEKLRSSEEQLRLALVGAQRATRAKDQFIAVLSHELRTPLTPVLTGAALLRQDRHLDADTHETLEMIHRNAELEARLIDDLLDITRIARGKVELHREPVALTTVLKHTVEVCLPEIEAHNLHFGMDVPETPLVVQGDAARLQQVFWNLLKNAIKFTPQGGSVRIRVYRDDAGYVIAEINDSGVGIEPEALHRIFRSFEQEERGTTRQFGGLGLGLAISKAMVEMHGGTISAHSDGKGKGATFQVRLPLTTDPAALTAVASSSPATPAEPVLSPRPLRILLVEDHGDTARIMTRLLRAEGHQVAAAADVASALKLAQEQKFDLLISDLGLPDGSGLDIMRTLRKKRVDLPGIALSGYGLETDIQQSREAGFVVHLTKPVSLPKLGEAMVQAVGCGIGIARGRGRSASLARLLPI